MKWQRNTLNLKVISSRLQALSFKKVSDHSVSAGLFFLTVLLAFLSALIIRNYTSQPEVLPLLWKTYSREGSAQNGYLLELVNEEKKLAVYIATDRAPETQDYFLEHGWSLSLLSEGVIWDPRVCAKMPITITSTGDVFMLDAERVGRGIFSASFIHFSRENKILREVNIDDIGWSGPFLFQTEEGMPYFFSLKNNILKRYTYHNLTESLYGVRFYDLAESEIALLARTAEGLPAVSIFNDTTLSSKKYVISEDGLTHFDGDLPLTAARYSDKDKTIYDLGRKMSARYWLESPYETAVLYEESTVLSFNKNAEVYSFVLGSFEIK